MADAARISVNKCYGGNFSCLSTDEGDCRQPLGKWCFGALMLYGLNSFFNDTVFFVLCFLVILLYYVVYVMSKNSKKWLLSGFFLYLADTVCMVYYIWRAGLNQAWILELVAHVVILGFLLYGYFRAGKLERLERENAIMKVDRKYLMEFEVSDD